MPAEQTQQWISFLSELPLHGLLLVAVIVLWLELRKTRKALDDCLLGNKVINKRIDQHEEAISQLIEDVFK